MSRWRLNAALLGSVAAFLGSAFLLGPFIPDDSYISFRYAENLAAGSGLTFNPGEPPVEAYSNFLWILVCALVSKFGALPQWMPVVGLILGIGSLILVHRTLVRWAGDWKDIGTPVFLLAISPAFALYAVSAMETPLFIILLLGLVNLADALHARNGLGCWIIASLLGVALALTRPEGAIVFPIAWLVVGSKTRNAWIGAGLFVLLLGAYTFWRVNYFHSWLPVPFTSKGTGLGPLHTVSANLKILFVSAQGQFAPCGFYYIAIVLVTMLGLRITTAPRSRSQSVAFVLGIALVAVYINFLDWMPGQRYFSVVVPLMCIPGAALLRSSARPAIWSVMIPLLALSLDTTSKLRSDAHSLQQSTARSLIPLGRWLHDAVPPQSLLAVSDVGAIPYFSRLRTVDTNPHSLTDLKIARNGFHLDDFFARRADVAIFVSFSTQKPLFYPEHQSVLADPRFGQYRLIGITPYNLAGRCYWVYARNTLVLAPQQMLRFPNHPIQVW